MRQKHAWLVHIVLIFFSFLFAFPLLWMISTSLKPIGETMSDNIQWIPSHIQWHNYYDAITYEQNRSAHLKTEFGFDVVQIARGAYLPTTYHSFIGFEDYFEQIRAFADTYAIRPMAAG